jgi:hypothetical protein
MLIGEDSVQVGLAEEDRMVGLQILALVQESTIVQESARKYDMLHGQTRLQVCCVHAACHENKHYGTCSTLETGPHLFCCLAILVLNVLHTKFRRAQWQCMSGFQCDGQINGQSYQAPPTVYEALGTRCTPACSMKLGANNACLVSTCIAYSDSLQAQHVVASNASATATSMLHSHLGCVVHVDILRLEERDAADGTDWHACVFVQLQSSLNFLHSWYKPASMCSRDNAADGVA